MCLYPISKLIFGRCGIFRASARTTLPSRVLFKHTKFVITRWCTRRHESIVLEHCKWKWRGAVTFSHAMRSHYWIDVHAYCVWKRSFLPAILSHEFENALIKGLSLCKSPYCSTRLALISAFYSTRICMLVHRQYKIHRYVFYRPGRESIVSCPRTKRSVLGRPIWGWAHKHEATEPPTQNYVISRVNQIEVQRKDLALAAIKVSRC